MVEANSAWLEDGTLAGSILQMHAVLGDIIAYTACALAGAITLHVEWTITRGNVVYQRSQ